MVVIVRKISVTRDKIRQVSEFLLDLDLLVRFPFGFGEKRSFTDFDLVLFSSRSGTPMTNTLEARSQRKFAKSTMSSATWVAGFKVGRM